MIDLTKFGPLTLIMIAWFRTVKAQLLADFTLPTPWTEQAMAAKYHTWNILVHKCGEPNGKISMAYGIIREVRHLQIHGLLKFHPHFPRRPKKIGFLLRQNRNFLESE